MPSFRDLLTGIANAWQNERSEILRVGGQLAEHLRRANLAPGKDAILLTRTCLTTPPITCTNPTIGALADGAAQERHNAPLPSTRVIQA
jgi:hypothetical protein